MSPLVVAHEAYIEGQVELVLDRLVKVPALALPLVPVLVRLDREPVVVVLLVLLDVLDERRVLLLQPLHPLRPITRTRTRLQQRNLLHAPLRLRVEAATTGARRLRSGGRGRGVRPLLFLRLRH